MSQTSSLSEKVERAAKVVGALIAVCTAVIGVSSWLFNSAMSSRDRHIERLSTELREMKTDLKDSSSATNRKIDSLSEDVIRLKIAIIASKAEVDLRSEQIVSPPSSRPRGRPRGAGDSASQASSIDGLIDSVMPVVMVTDSADDLPHHETVVDVDGSSVVIDDPETARTLYTNAISQIETEPPGVSRQLMEETAAAEGYRVLATTNNTE